MSAAAQTRQSRRGAPLAMLALLLTAWISGRMLLWESPFAAAEILTQAAESLLADAADLNPVPEPVRVNSNPDRSELDSDQGTVRLAMMDMDAALTPDFSTASLFSSRSGSAFGHQLLWMAAMSHLPVPRTAERALTRPILPSQWSLDRPGDDAGSQTGKANLEQGGSGVDGSGFIPARAGTASARDRWSLDAWAFFREGSNAGLVSQGNTPILGASQAGGILQYGLAPQSQRDPRAYLRAYRALVENGETEIAAGLSARPFASLPLRAHGEVRVLEGADNTDVRGSAFVTTELPPLPLPLGTSAEAYAQGGFVAGDGTTLFADGQASLTRNIADFDLGEIAQGHISVGGGAWAGIQGGGAQQEVHRVDLGPTVRMDISIGQVPARVSVDWRERVSGDAVPTSGVAATLSTRF
ncbi:MAG: hypothetical protein ABJP48_12030 [Erythrobacter sp.]